MSPFGKRVPLRVALIAPLLALLVFSLACSASLRAVNHARDLYNETSIRAVQAHEIGVISNTRWDTQVQPTLKLCHDTIDQAYLAMENGVSLDVSQLKPSKDPSHPTLYDQMKALLEELQ